MTTLVNGVVFRVGIWKRKKTTVSLLFLATLDNIFVEFNS